MKDIDFDELDKAVNSLMTKTQKNQPDAASTAPVQSDIDPAHNAPSRDEPDMPTTAAPISPGTIKPKSAEAINPDTQPAITPEPKPNSKPVAQSSRAAAPAARRGGRFMDVVPKKSSTPSTPPRPASREGVTISPRPNALATTTSTESATSSESQPTPQPKPSVDEKVAPKSDWPDPIEVATAQKPMTQRDLPEKKPEEPQTPESAKPEEESEKRPLTSPFLPNAKVEKRPLGSQKPNVPMVPPESELEAPESDDSEAQLPAKPSDVGPEAPAEFGGDVVQVEADTHMGVPKTDEPIEQQPEMAAAMSSQAAGKITPTGDEAKTSTAKQKENELAEESTPKPQAVEKSDTPTTAETPSASGRISIPPQYKEQPSTGEKESGAIYDTSTYHQPLAHPAKKKSGWLWVLWIILILIVGAGAGAALYFLGVM